jgi:hypothetical protein
LRPFGFNKDDLKELPISYSRNCEFTDYKKFLVKIGHLVTLISVCIINKSILKNIDARIYCGTNLVQVNLCINAAMRSEKNLIIRKYQIAVKRNNSSGYDRSQVFVTNLLDIYDKYIGNGLDLKDVVKIENKLIIYYYPFYLYKLMKENDKLTFINAKNIYDRRFKNSLTFNLFLRPIFYLPKPLAVFWIINITILGRVLSGDFIRAIFF